MIAGPNRSPLEVSLKGELGLKAAYREVIETDGTYALREAEEAYGFNFAADIRL